MLIALPFAPEVFLIQGVIRERGREREREKEKEEEKQRKRKRKRMLLLEKAYLASLGSRISSGQFAAIPNLENKPTKVMVSALAICG